MEKGKPYDINKPVRSGIDKLERDNTTLIHVTAAIIQLSKTTRAQGYKTFFMLNSTEHEISAAHKN